MVVLISLDVTGVQDFTWLDPGAQPFSRAGSDETSSDRIRNQGQESKKRNRQKSSEIHRENMQERKVQQKENTKFEPQETGEANQHSKIKREKQSVMLQNLNSNLE